jgi:hypothetical protein
LFDEDGVYSLERYDLDGAGFSEIDSNTRENAFLMKLDAGARVAQVAMCGETEGDLPSDSLCRVLGGETSSWFCSCYAYAFGGSEMLWRPFSPDETPPDVAFPGESGDTQIVVEIVEGVAGMHEFSPLPEGVFGSDGVDAAFRFQLVAPSIFDQVFDDPEGRPGCTPCI